MRVIIRVFHELTGCVLELLRADRIVKDKIDCLEAKDPVSNYRDDGRSRLPAEVLMQHLEKELDRRVDIEAKARTNVLGITLAVSAMFAGVALISSDSSVDCLYGHWSTWVLFASFFVGVSFLLVGGGLALHALRIAKIYTWTLQDEAKDATDGDRAATTLWYVELNERTTLLKTNQVDASYSCIRNGVIALAVAAVFAAVSRLG